MNRSAPLSPAPAEQPLSGNSSQPPAHASECAGESDPALSAAHGSAPTGPAAEIPAPVEATDIPSSGAGRFNHERLTALAPARGPDGDVRFLGARIRRRHAASPPHIADALLRLRRMAENEGRLAGLYVSADDIGAPPNAVVKDAHDMIVALALRMYGQAELAVQETERASAATLALRQRGAVNANAAIDREQICAALALFAINERHRADLARRAGNDALRAAHEGAAAFVETLIEPFTATQRSPT